MSSHRSQRAINLHHQQVEGAKQRRAQRQTMRLQRFLCTRESIQTEVRQIRVALSCYGFIWFLFAAALTTEYLWLIY